MSALEPDRDQIEIFVDAIFRHASPQGYVSIRAFYENREESFRITPTSLAGGLPHLIDVAEDDARRAANAPEPVVFCPPLATFVNGKNAKEVNLAEGLTLSVECDQHPSGALLTLEQLLGQPTVITLSGGTWTDTRTGAVHDKLHLHWRLAVPARGELLPQLKQARDLATRLVGGDPSNKPVCHPIRWPGSWHRKGEPILCRMESWDPDREIDLTTALEILIQHAPAPAQTGNGRGNGSSGHVGEDWTPLISKIVSGEQYHPALAPLASKLVTAGTHPGATTNILRAIMNSSSKARPDRWQTEYDKIPETVESAEQKFRKPESKEGEPAHGAPEAKPEPLVFLKPAEWEGVPVPPRRWLVSERIPMAEVTGLSGDGGMGKTTIGLQLCVNTQRGTDWLGAIINEQGPAIFFTAEEPRNEIHFRLNAIREHFGLKWADLKDVYPFCAIDEPDLDPVLGMVDRKSGLVVPTKMFFRLQEAVLDIKPKLICVEAASDVFAVNEIDRQHAKGSVRLLHRLAMKADTAVLLFSHPSLSGLSSGTGTSGSTQWNNAVRARMYFSTVKTNGDDLPTETKIKCLEIMKNNRGPTGERVMLRWENNVFVPAGQVSGLTRVAEETKVDELFLKLLDIKTAQGIELGLKDRAVTYAARVFENMAEAGGIKAKAFTRAIERLLSAGRIRPADSSGPPSKRFQILARP